jgi:small-conductance mechanosensitive channel
MRCTSTIFSQFAFISVAALLAAVSIAALATVFAF